MINYENLYGVQFMPIEKQVKVFQVILFEAIRELPNEKNGDKEFEAVKKFISSVTISRKWMTITELKEKLGHHEYSNIRIGLALTKHNIPKKRAKVKGAVCNVYYI